jgi:hypothetical protein
MMPIDSAWRIRIPVTICGLLVRRPDIGARGIPGGTCVEAETPSTAKPDDRSMWPNGDNFELGAYRARCVAVTG